MAQRVATIVDMMATGAWTAKAAIELGRRWKLDVATVQKSSAEASRLVRGYLLPPAEETQALLVGRLDEAFAMAKGQFDAKGMVAAVLAHDKITGASGPQKLALTNTKGEDLPEYVRRDWPIAVWNWALAQGRVVGEAEMAAKAEELAATPSE